MFFHSLYPKKSAEKKEDNLACDFRLIFDLPLIQHTLAGADWIYDPNNWKMDEASIEMFNRARDGQGFSVIAFIENDLTTNKPMAKTVIFPAYNGQDGLPKEDKFGVPYQFLEYVETKAEFGQSGVGAIHKMSANKYILKNELDNSNSALAKQVAVTMKKTDPMIKME